MNGIRLAIEDVKRMWKSHILKLTLIGLILMPLIYSFIYLWAFWDPTSYLVRYPIAIVNSDKGVLQGTEQINLGIEMVKKLGEDKTTKWAILSEGETEKALKDGKYYMVVQIPSDFSEKAYSVSTDKPEHPQLIYKINEGISPLGATISRKIIGNIKNGLQTELSTKYLKVIFDNIMNGGEGLKKAAEGAAKLAEGTDTAYQGAVSVKNGLTQSKDGMEKLSDGLSQLLSGANKLENGIIKLNTMVNLASEGVNKISPEVSDLLNSVDDFNALVKERNNSLKQSIQIVNQNVNSVKNLISSTDKAKQELVDLQKSYVAPLQDLTQKQGESIDAVASDLNALKDKYPQIAQDPLFSSALSNIEKIRGYKEAITTNQSNLKNALVVLNGNISDVNGNLSNLAQTMQQSADNITKDVDALTSNEIIDKINSSKGKLESIPTQLKTLAEGTNQLQDGSTQLVEGINTFSNKFTQLQSGTTQLLDGTQKLEEGLKEINVGQNRLANELGNAATMASKDGNADKRIDIIADPVNVEELNLHPVPNNGTGFAPYFIALSLWVGSLVLFFLVDLKKVSAMPARPLSYMVNKFVCLASVSMAQSVVSIFILHNGLGIITTLAPIQLYGFAIIIGLCYSAILFMLFSFLEGDPGKFVAIVILMLQLTSSSGSYPYQLEPKFFGFIRPFLPMTYAVEGLRAVISTNDQFSVIRSSIILVLFGLAALVILYVVKRKTFLIEISTHENSL